MTRRVAIGVAALLCVVSACAGESHVRGAAAVPARKATPGRRSDRVDVASVEHNDVVMRDADHRFRWAMLIDNGTVGEAVVAGDRVLVAGENDDGTGWCKGLDRETGATHWTYIYLGGPAVGVARAANVAICLMRDGATVETTLESGFVLWQFLFATDIPPSSVFVPRHSAIAVDEAAGLFGFDVRIDGASFWTRRRIETGHIWDLTAGSDPGRR